jgi:hypothetical protein
MSEILIVERASVVRPGRKLEYPRYSMVDERYRFRDAFAQTLHLFVGSQLSSKFLSLVRVPP